MSSVEGAPATELIYSMSHAYGGRRGHWLPGAWYVAALTQLGISESAVRQALFRMAKQGTLDTLREGRSKWYRLSVRGSAETSVGAEKIHGPATGSWDGMWTFVHYRFATDERAARDHVHEILELEGFGALARGVYIHPRDRAAVIEQAVNDAGVAQGRFVVFRGQRVGGESNAELVCRLWDLDSIETGYRDFLDRFEPVLRRQRVPSPRRAFGLRVACVLAYLGTAWDDPDLPAELLPRRWPGPRAQETASRLYEKLLPGTLQFGDDLMRKIGMTERPGGRVPEWSVHR